MIDLDLVQWPAMVVTVGASWLVASKREGRRSAGFWVFLLSNAIWIAWGLHSGAHALVVLQVCLAAMNIRGAMQNRTMAEAAPRSMSRGRLAGLATVFLWFAIGGIAHFIATETEMRIVPPYVPWPRAAVLASGVFELLGAAGLLWRSTRRAAGIGLFLLTLAVTPCHVYMLQRPELFPAIPSWALWLRLPVQAALLWLIIWCTAPDARGRRVA